MAKNAKQGEHYVNNKEFTAAVAEHNAAVVLAEEEGKTPPQMSNYIGECIYKIATRLSTRPNFINYTYRDEMICDAIENCIQYIKNFNIEKSNNAFAYITQICYYAFLRRIQKEKKQVFIKQQIISDITQETFETIDGDTTGMHNTNVEWMQENMNRVQYEPRKSKRKKPLKTKGLDKFTE
jgi:DNA-directed RNA polymerase specialized sigma24 family protein